MSEFITAIKTIDELSRELDEKGLYRRMEITPEDGLIVTICMSPLCEQYYIVCRDSSIPEKDCDFWMLSKRDTIRYIAGLENITRVSIDTGYKSDEGRSVHELRYIKSQL